MARHQHEEPLAARDNRACSPLLTVEQSLVQLVEQAAPVAESSPPIGQEPVNNPKRPIWDVIAGRMKMLPPEVFERLPEDGASQHDHYIYGLPKRDQ